MKKIYNYLFVGIVAMLSMTLSSCNDDNNIADTLNGIWEGEVSQSWSWRWDDYTVYQYVEMEFITDPYRYAKGYGYEYDYYRNSRYYEKCRFYFEVRNGRIYLDYDDGARVCISNYRLTNYRFEGTFRDYRTGDYLADFSFVKIASYRYDRYNYIYGTPAEFEDSKTNKTEAEQK